MSIRDFEKNKVATMVNEFAPSNSNFLIMQYGWEQTEPGNTNYGAGIFALHFIVRGKLNVSYQGKKYVAQKNSCFLLRPTKSIQYVSDSKSPANYYWVAVSGSEAANFFRSIGFSDDKIVVNIPHYWATKIRDAFSKTLSLQKEFHNAKHVYMYESFYRIARNLYLSQLNMDSFLSVPPSLSPTMKKVVAYIQEHYTDCTLTVQSTAKALFLHPNYLSSLFKKELGTNFKIYLAQKRIHYAGILIRQGENNVGIIAYKVGIPDAAYFTKVFKKINLITPRQEIAQQQAKKIPPPQE